MLFLGFTLWFDNMFGDLFNEKQYEEVSCDEADSGAANSSTSFAANHLEHVYSHCSKSNKTQGLGGKAQTAFKITTFLLSGKCNSKTK